ncbi:DUF308 domain-containing protein [Spongiactinospora sp. 9N601]|uniref:DUF308 domain-containing protein n=1 Tax=Spongiactinospora sp. 9N601 TaxID=3375149 RepID=UPI00379C1878
MNIRLGVVDVLTGVLLIALSADPMSTIRVIIAISLLVSAFSEWYTAVFAVRRRTLHGLLGFAWTAAAVLVAAWPGITVGVLATVLGVVMVGEGVLRMYRDRDDPDDRTALRVNGVATVLAGLALLALAVAGAAALTLTAVAVVYAARTVLAGAERLVARLSAGGRVARWARIAGPLAVTPPLVLAVLLVAVLVR